MKTVYSGAAALALCASSPLVAAISVDGTLDADYGAATATVLYNPAAPTSNFGTPTNENHTTSYDIYGTIQGDNLYGFWQATPDQQGETNAGNFVNLYLDTDPDSSPGSDLGFQITSQRAFKPSTGQNVAATDVQFAIGTNAVEFLIPLAYLRNGVTGLSDFSEFVAPGGRFTFRLSQAFGYSVAGGATYGDNRLGSFVMPGAVPEPATWAMMICGFAFAGTVARRRRGTLATA
ncbi:PEPxxWA-CTERM sorting domain-containing protein [Sphingomonas sp.]|uniref:PEPxxWA-CTERM sorting domain-containing protein n=1 Tax=Sphingomonas sp. TaxID=28214 RepID=UPI002DBD328E|nr:PEPxxWA-CTERM sorting domain-containing protein [Sphingomonas sp.]HEU4968159.1 PEPxxWA-CTERM sorting domain-containing protein [Sphingomonas sp.]